MKFADVQKLREAGLITSEQAQRIVDHFKLREDGNRFLIIISVVGSVLVAAGIVLLIAANWEEIPRWVKIAAGMALMLGTHGAGWYLRENPLKPPASERGSVTRSGPGMAEALRVTDPRSERAGRGNYQKTGEALHLLGSLLFLGNIALVGQIYHLVSRPPNAILLWWAGIAVLPWLLRSPVQHLLALLAFGVWFGMEVNQDGSPIYLREECQVLAYALLGLIHVGLGYVLRRGTFATFAKPTEHLGMFALLVFSYPLTWQGFMRNHNGSADSSWILPVLGAVAVVLVALGAKNLELDRQWRWTWTLGLALAAALLIVVFYLPHERKWTWFPEYTPVNGLAAAALFAFCLLQIQVGLQERSTSLVNLGVVFIALDMIAAYIGLFGTMARTGLMFVVSGVFLIVFGVYLEKKRRKFMVQIKTAQAGKENLP